MRFDLIMHGPGADSCISLPIDRGIVSAGGAWIGSGWPRNLTWCVRLHREGASLGHKTIQCRVSFRVGRGPWKLVRHLEISAVQIE